MSEQHAGYGAGADAPQEGRSTDRSIAWGCVIAVVAGSAVLGLLLIAFVLLTFASAVAGAGHATVSAMGVDLRQVTVGGTPGAPRLVQVPLRGILMPGGSSLGNDPRRVLGAMLDQAREDAAAAVILRVDSPGGGITTCDKIHRAVAEFRAETGLPVVALMEDVAASGGYYVSCAADHIVAHPTTVTGSIGVLMPIYDASRLMQMVGVRNRTLATGEFKDLGSPFAERTPEEWERHKEVLDGLLQFMHARFVQVVADGRGLEPHAVRQLADGRVYNAEQAVEHGLIDEIGYEEAAVEVARRLAGIEEFHLVEYSRRPSLREMLLFGAREPGVTLRLDGAASLLEPPRLMYLWQAAGPPLAE